MSQLVSEVWLQCCQLLSHAFSVITFLMHHVEPYAFKPREGQYVAYDLSEPLYC